MNGLCPIRLGVFDSELDRYLLDVPNRCSAITQPFPCAGASLEPRAAGAGLADSGCYYQAMNTADLLPTALSHYIYTLYT